MSKVTYLLKKRASCDIHWDVHPDPLHRKACPSLLLGVLSATDASCQLLQSLPKLDRVPWPRIHPSQGTPNPMADYHWGLRSNLLGSLKNSCNGSYTFQDTLWGELRFCWTCIAISLLPLPKLASSLSCPEESIPKYPECKTQKIPARDTRIGTKSSDSTVRSLNSLLSP